MKRLFTIMAAVLLTASVFAQAPQKMSYQAVIRDASNHLVITQVGMKISILQGSESGDVKYVEVQTPTPNANGLVTIQIGDGDPVAFAAINWAAGPYYIKTETATEAPLTTYTIEGTSQLLSVPYALHAKTVAGYTEADPVFETFGVKTTGNQTIDGNKTFTGTTTVPAPVNSTDAATKAYVDELKIMILDLQAENGVTDPRDGTYYSAVRIGNQIWMAKKLAYLPVVHSNAEFETQGNSSLYGYGVYGYNGSDIATAKSQANYTTYGVLYNWWAAMDGAGSSSSNPSGVQGVCPTGWHLPSHAEWTELTDYLGGTSVAGGKLKETGTIHWTDPNYGATNETGFTALPGGTRSYTGTFNSIGFFGYLWSSTQISAGNALYSIMYYDNSNVDMFSTLKGNGFSVRCLRD